MYALTRQLPVWLQFIRNIFGGFFIDSLRINLKEFHFGQTYTG